METEAPRPARRTVERFWSLVHKDGDDGCWEWTGRLTSSGYGRYWGRPNISCHRWVYLTLVGPVPEGLQLDHLCRNRACCNPAHLEPVTGRENILRGIGPTAENARKTECANGHSLTPDNVYAWRDHRMCRQCRRVRRRDWNRRNRQRMKVKS